jgi:hypothetical protein
VRLFSSHTDLTLNPEVPKSKDDLARRAVNVWVNPFREGHGRLDGRHFVATSVYIRSWCGNPTRCKDCSAASCHSISPGLRGSRFAKLDSNRLSQIGGSNRRSVSCSLAKVYGDSKVSSGSHTLTFKDPALHKLCCCRADTL